MTSSTWQRPGYDFDPGAVRSLPPDAYASADIFEREMQTAFSPEAGLKYVGHDILLDRKSVV